MPTETLSGLIQVIPQEIYFPKTIDLPCFRFRAAVFIRLKSLFAARFKLGSDGSHFKIPLTVRDKVTRQCPQTTTFQEKGEPKRIRTEVPLLTRLTPYR